MSTNLALLSYKATGTTKSRTHGDRAADVFNVKDYGAIGDGSNATSAIQAAINDAIAVSGGRVCIPRGQYQITAPLTCGPGSVIIEGDGLQSVLFGNFEGFIFDQLSDPYQANAHLTIRDVSIQNAYVGNNFTGLSAASSWSASGSNVNVTMAVSNPGNVSAGCLVYSHSIAGSNTWVLVGTVKTWIGTALVLNSAVHASGGSSDSLSFVQVYSAGAAWSGGDPTITMGLSRPAGVPTGMCLVYSYTQLNNGTYNGLFAQALGVGSWSGTTFTFNNSTGAWGGSEGTYPGTPDQLCFAPLAGGIRISSSVACSTVSGCSVSGFIGITCSEVFVPVLGGGGDPQGAFSFSVLLENNTLSNPTAGAAIGSTGMVLCENSLSLVNDASGYWIGTRMNGNANNIFGGRHEVCNFGIYLGQDTATASSPLVDSIIMGMSLESCVTAGILSQNSGAVLVAGLGMGGQSGNSRWGAYLREGTGIFTMISSGFSGAYNDGCIYVPDGGGQNGLITFISVNCYSTVPGVVAWRIPTSAWSAKFINSNNGPSVYTFAGLPPAGTITGGSISGTTFTCSGLSGSINNLSPGHLLTGSGVTAGTVIIAGTGGAGVSFRVNNSQTSSPTGFIPAVEGDTYDISDSANSTWLSDPSPGGGSGSSARRRVRFSPYVGAWQVIG